MSEAEPGRQRLSPEWQFAAQMTGVTLLSIGAAYGCAAVLGTRAPNLFARKMYVGYSLLALFFIGCISVLALTLSLMAKKEPRPLQVVWRHASGFLTPAALADRVLPIVLTFGFLSAFSTFKQLIPRMNAYSWDGRFSDLDRWIFGTDPWRYTHALIGPAATEWIDFAYVLWVPVFTVVVFWHAVFVPFEQKRRFFLTFVTCWIVLGIISATVFSSAGPCFLSLLGHPYADRYSFFPLDHGPGSQAIMDYLATGYRTGDFGFAKGISAMPSMHIAVVTLYLITARKPWTIGLSALYFLLIFVGSVHLGWHYAVDGIFGALGTIIIYWAISKTGEKRPASSDGKMPAFA